MVTVQLHDPADAADRAVAWLRARPGGAVVALSGGADSALVLDLAVEAYGADGVVAATSRSESLPAEELTAARAQAARLEVEHVPLSGSEVDVPAFQRNTPDRCFHCKQTLYGEVRALAEARGLAHVVDGTNADDAGEHRPGLAAGERIGVLSPLLAVGISKPWVRAISRHRGLDTWDKPADACLSSRIPYGTEVTRAGLDRVYRAERVLRDLGFRELRVRVHDPIARVEVPPSTWPALLAPGVREAVVDGLKALGFTYVALDIEGLRSGSMNEGLRQRGAD